METTTPKWLDEKLLKLAILDGDTSVYDVNVRNFKVKPAVESGNNYCSILYRVKVEYYVKDSATTHFKSFIIKSPLIDGGYIQDIVNEAKLLTNEHNVYTKILPEMYKIYNHRFSPKNYFCQLNDFLVLEDLSEEGYTMCDRRKQLDYLHSKQFLVTLAKYHATTVALHHKMPEFVESNGNEPFYNSPMIKSNKMGKNNQAMFTIFGNIIEKYDKFELLAAAIHKKKTCLVDLVVKVFNRRSKFNVLNHGDSWTNNMLFKYDQDGVLMDCKLIDFQIRRYGSPAIDLLYFLFTSVKGEVRESHMEDLVSVYRETLNDTLSELGYKDDRISAEDLEEELRQMCCWVLLVVVVYLPSIVQDPNETDTIDSDADIYKNPLLKPLLGKTYNTLLPNICKDLISLGIMKYLTDEN